MKFMFLVFVKNFVFNNQLFVLYFLIKNTKNKRMKKKTLAIDLESKFTYKFSFLFG